MSYASGNSVPRTPPYTPRRPKTQVEQLSSSPSSMGPVTPDHIDTTTKPPTDDIPVEDLVEGDIGYVADSDDLVYPEEIEEVETESETAMSSSSEAEDPNDTGLLRRLSRLRCGDDSEVVFEMERRSRHLQKRAAASRLHKRPHSQLRNSGAETTDPEVLDGHDLISTQRRLRRRTKGPDDVDMIHLARLAAIGSTSAIPPHLWEKHGRNLTPGGSTAEEDDSDSDSDDEPDHDGPRRALTPRQTAARSSTYSSGALPMQPGFFATPVPMDVDA